MATDGEAVPVVSTVAALLLLLLAVSTCPTRAEQQPTDAPPACTIFADDCESCLDAGCAWQPGTGGDCYPGCLIMDTSCYVADGRASSICPLTQSVCAQHSTCLECAHAGCVFQRNACIPECRFGPLGSFLARCARDAAGCGQLLLSASSVEVQPAGGSCSDFADDCASCVDKGCAWQPGTGGDCYPDCLIQDTSCYVGNTTTCPQSHELCATMTTCSECASAGCIFQQGACKPECEFGPLGDFIAPCASHEADCPALLISQLSESPKQVDSDICATHHEDCPDCLASGCMYQADGVSGGECVSECLAPNSTCVQSAASCPGASSIAAPLTGSYSNTLIYSTTAVVAVFAFIRFQ